MRSSVQYVATSCGFSVEWVLTTLSGRLSALEPNAAASPAASPTATIPPATKTSVLRLIPPAFLDGPGLLAITKSLVRAAGGMLATWANKVAE